MLKKFLTVTVITAGICCSASKVRIDIDGLEGTIGLKPGNADKSLKVANADWLKNKSQYYLTIHSSDKLTAKWQKFSFSFTPDKDGIVKINFLGVFYKPQGAKKNIEVWAAYDNITITGTEAKNCDFEFVNQKNLFDGWEGDESNMVTGAEDAKSGKNYVIAWHDNPVYQTLKVKKGQEVTVTFFAKTSQGPVKDNSDFQNI
ncbi:MAG: hypothetical protein PHV82_07210 [Victivallaceae bacterium]|nr:hypothetical protein [Victivallaceae bacterium]